MPIPINAGCAANPKASSTIKQHPTANNVEHRNTESPTMITVGRKAPDFTTKAFYNGAFVNVSLSEYAGQWVVLCFYPGDFTFV